MPRGLSGPGGTRAGSGSPSAACCATHGDGRRPPRIAALGHDLRDPRRRRPADLADADRVGVHDARAVLRGRRESGTCAAPRGSRRCPRPAPPAARTWSAARCACRRRAATGRTPGLALTTSSYPRSKRRAMSASVSSWRAKVTCTCPTTPVDPGSNGKVCVARGAWTGGRQRFAARDRYRIWRPLEDAAAAKRERRAECGRARRASHHPAQVRRAPREATRVITAMPAGWEARHGLALRAAGESDSR